MRSHRLKAAGYAKGFALMKQWSCGKVVLDWRS
jgi:threonine 3-dehydrogenase